MPDGRVSREHGGEGQDRRKERSVEGGVLEQILRDDSKTVAGQVEARKLGSQRIEVSVRKLFDLQRGDQDRTVREGCADGEKDRAREKKEGNE